MKTKLFTGIAAAALALAAAMPFASCCKESQGDTPFAKTTAKLEKGGIAYSYTEMAPVNKMVGLTMAEVDKLAGDSKEIAPVMKALHAAVDSIGLESIQGSGSSAKKHGDLYRTINFCYAPEAGRKGMLWDLFGDIKESKGKPAELTLISKDAMIAGSGKINAAGLYQKIDAIVRSALSAEEQAELDKQISGLHAQGIQPDKLISSITGITVYINAREYKEAEFNGLLAAGNDIAGAILAKTPKFALILHTKDDLCWKALSNIVAKANPDMVKGDKVEILPGLDVFQNGNYLIFTNDATALRDRLAGKGENITANPVFQKYSALAPSDYTGFSWFSKDYAKTLMQLSAAISALNGQTDSMSKFNPISACDTNAFGVLSITKDGILSTSVIESEQFALIGGSTIEGVIAGYMPMLVSVVANTMKESGALPGMDAAERAERMSDAKTFYTSAAAAQKKSGMPVGVGAAELLNNKLVMVQWDAAKKEFQMFPDAKAEIPDTEFSFLFLSPAKKLAENAKNPARTIVFYEDPDYQIDGVHVIFADGHIEFLVGNFDNSVDVIETAVNTFDIPNDIAADLLKDAALLDKAFSEVGED